MINTVQNIIKNGTEANDQIKVYDKHGFKKLKKYLMTSVDYETKGEIMSRKIVHVVGTGTIGEPLIGLLCDFKDDTRY